MQLDKLYFQVKNYIDKLDFAKLWNGFAPLKFALYTDDECFFDGNYIPKTSEFLANTCIQYKGESVAIWYLQQEMDPVVLTSKIVHEMFHGFQSMRGECCFPDELDVLCNYNYTEANLDLKLAENHLLCSLSQQFDSNVYAQLLGMRKYRAEKFPYEYHYEACIEQMEGSADFVELMCLKQLSSQLFEQRLASIKQRITDAHKLFPVRIVCYDTGALFLYILMQNNIAFDDGFTSTPFAESLLNGVTPHMCQVQYSTKDALMEFYSNASKTVQTALLKNDVVCDVHCDLLGVNVYNAIYYQNYIISQFFVMFGSQENPQVQMGNFVIQTTDCKKLTKIYRI